MTVLPYSAGGGGPHGTGLAGGIQIFSLCLVGVQKKKIPNGQSTMTGESIVYSEYFE